MEGKEVVQALRQPTAWCRCSMSLASGVVLGQFDDLHIFCARQNLGTTYTPCLLHHSLFILVLHGIREKSVCPIFGIDEAD